MNKTFLTDVKNIKKSKKWLKNKGLENQDDKKIKLPKLNTTIKRRKNLSTI